MLCDYCSLNLVNRCNKTRSTGQVLNNPLHATHYSRTVHQLETHDRTCSRRCQNVTLRSKAKDQGKQSQPQSWLYESGDNTTFTLLQTHVKQHCLSVCLYVCVYVCMHVCMYVYVYGEDMCCYYCFCIIIV